MASYRQQAVWSTPCSSLWSRPCSSPRCSFWHPFLPCELTVLRPQFSAGDRAGTVFPSRQSPYNTGLESLKENKRFFLDRSVFDLVDAHRYLSLTDQKLLNWYLGLSKEDRKLIQDEGGLNQFLQKHPALELSSHHVYVKYDIRSGSPVQPAKRHIKSAGKTCTCGPYTQQEWNMLPSSIKETLSLQAGLQSAFDSHITQEPNHHTVHTVTVPPLYRLSEEKTWPMANSCSIAVHKDPAALASFSVDVELERCKQEGKAETTNVSLSEDEPLQSEWIKNHERIQMEFREGSSEERSVDKVSSSCEESIDHFHSVIEDDQSILACWPPEKVGAGLRETSEPGLTAERSISPLPRLATCDVMVGTEQATCTPAFTQTEEPRTSDKHIITEVHMADLDYLAEEFIKLKKAEEELKEQNEKMKSSGCLWRKECECVERAQQAELCLLALQYSMCRQHTWRLYCTSAEGDQLATLAGHPPADILSVLHTLESDFNQMRAQILAGLPLAQLKPLSVDCEKLTTGARSYIPAQIICDLLGSVPSSGAQEPQNPEPPGEENRRAECGSRSAGQTEEKEMKAERRKARRAVTLLLQERNPVHEELQPEEKQTVSCKELNSSEAWYDAEEDLCAAGGDGVTENISTSEEFKESSSSSEYIWDHLIYPEFSSEPDKTSVLFVSNLPRDVTERDVMKQFERYRAAEVSVSALKEGVSVAIVMINGPQCAEAAVRELNGCSMRGHTLHVEHINRAAEGQSQAPASISGPESPQTPSRSERQLTAQPPHGSTAKTRKVVCISPTAKGTCVPQHYCTMGSFDSLMAELTQRHPGVGRQRIVDALLELKAKHQGVLSGLPLRTIRDMTSELLTGPARPELF